MNEQEIKERLETLDWLVDHLMIASGLLELKISSMDNCIWKGWTHNGIPIQDKDFYKHQAVIRKIAKERK